MSDLTQWDPRDVPQGMVASYRGHDCCDVHTVTCEPPSELCCESCPEVEHPAHPPATLCVLTVAALWVEHMREAAALLPTPQEMVAALRALLEQDDRPGHHEA